MHSKTEMKTGGGRTHGSVYKLKWLPEFTNVCKCLLVRIVCVYGPKVWTAQVWSVCTASRFASVLTSG